MKINYEDKIVAFIDVLGFSNIVYSDKTEAIDTYYEMLLTGFSSAAAKNHLDYLLISDSIVVYTPLTKDNLITLTKVLCELQYKLLLKGILCRGGISQGKLFTDKTNNIVVGTGLINAYKLESRAIYPKIIIDRSLICPFFGGTDQFISGLNWKVRLSPPVPYVIDFPYIDYTGTLVSANQPYKFDSVIKFLKTNYYNNEHINKYEWLKSHIDFSVKAMLKRLNGGAYNPKDKNRRIRLLIKFHQELQTL